MIRTLPEETLSTGVSSVIFIAFGVISRPRFVSNLMIAIDYIDIPRYLHSSHFYCAIGNDDCSAITIPRDCFKQNTSVHNIADFDHLLRTVRFWITEDPRLKLLTFFLANKVSRYLVEGCEQNDLLMSLPFGYDYLRLKLLLAHKRIEYAACSNMNLSIVERLHNLGHTLPKNLCSLAAKLNRTDLLQYAFSQHCAWGNTGKIATSLGHIDCLQFAMARKCPMSASLLQVAIEHGQLESLKCLTSVFPLHSSLSKIAAQKGHLHCLQYLCEQNIPWHKLTTECAAKCGYLNCLIYAHQHHCPLTNSIPTLACERSDVACLHYAVRHGCVVTEKACVAAARHGHLLCLQYAHKVGGGLSATVSRAAAQGGHLHCLRYLHAQGCPWDECVLVEAVWGNHSDCVVYALWHGCPCIKHCKVLLACVFTCLLLLQGLLYPETMPFIVCTAPVFLLTSVGYTYVLYQDKIKSRYLGFLLH